MDSMDNIASMDVRVLKSCVQVIFAVCQISLIDTSDLKNVCKLSSRIYIFMFWNFKLKCFLHCLVNGQTWLFFCCIISQPLMENCFMHVKDNITWLLFDGLTYSGLRLKHMSWFTEDVLCGNDTAIIQHQTRHWTSSYCSFFILCSTGPHFVLWCAPSL